jgi:hypothetical protein
VLRCGYERSKSSTKHSRRNYAYALRFSGGAKQNSLWGRHVVEQKARRDCVSCIFKLLERLEPSVHRRSAERSVRLGRCEVALDVEGVARALIGFPIGATMVLSAWMIVLFVFAAMGAALALWAGERSGSDPDLGAAWIPSHRGADARMFVAPDESPRRAALLLQAGGDCHRHGRERATRYLPTANMRIAARVRQHLGDTS